MLSRVKALWNVCPYKLNRNFQSKRGRAERLAQPSAMQISQRWMWANTEPNFNDSMSQDFIISNFLLIIFSKETLKTADYAYEIGMD